LANTTLCSRAYHGLLGQARGKYVAGRDDDGQNPPGEVRKMYDAIRQRYLDVMYGQYRVKHHSVWRNLGSAFNDRFANLVLNKPSDL
jgi:undecaprenyl-phosphate 4-deoxy-4-formamido-L-arabinose transferase